MGIRDRPDRYAGRRLAGGRDRADRKRGWAGSRDCDGCQGYVSHICDGRTRDGMHGSCAGAGPAEDGASKVQSVLHRVSMLQHEKQLGHRWKPRALRAFQ